MPSLLSLRLNPPMEYNRDNSGGHDTNSPETQGIQQNSLHTVNATPETAQGQLPSLLSLRLKQSPTYPFSMPNSDVGSVNYTRQPSAKQPHEAFIAATIGQESGGDYNARSGKDKLGREAYGKYQIMDFNIPSWTKQFYGKSLTPEQYLADRQAQDAVGRGRLKELFDKYGVEDGASYYFSGGPLSKNANKKDKNGKTVASYVADIKRRFEQELAKGVGTQVASAAESVPQKESSPLPSLLSLRLNKPFSINSVLDDQTQAKALLKGAKDLLLGPRPKTYGEAKERGLIPLEAGAINLPPETPVPDNAKFLDAFGMVGSMNNVGKGLTTKLLERLKSATKSETVTKQFIEDLTNQADIKQPEKDLFRKILNDTKESNINVPTFIDKVESELLPLKRKHSLGEYDKEAGDYVYPNGNRYESVTLPSEQRGPVANYSEHVYESPVKTSAGDVHFNNEPNYFAHTRIEDLPDNKTRRVIEAQSDLFQKGRLEAEGRAMGDVYGYADETGKAHAMPAAQRKAELSKLEPYRNTWHERIIREEVKQAAKDGKTKLQFPTGETAMKIEGLGDTQSWFGLVDGKYEKLTPERLKVGDEVAQGQWNQGQWIITDVLGDGKFKAMQARQFSNFGVLDHGVTPQQYLDIPAFEKRLVQKNGEGARDWINQQIEGRKKFLNENSETFDISGKVDTNNPIYKFYNKEVRRYLTNKYGAKEIVDPQGVSWIEVNVPKDAAKMPIEAFGIGALPFITQKDDENAKMR